MIISTCGVGTARSIASIMHSMCSVASRPGARPAPLPRSSTAKRQERRKRGAAIDPPGYDAGKKIRGKKRHILVDTQGLLLHAIVHPADLQDRDGGVLLLATLFGMFPFLLKLYADGGYQGPEFQQAVANILRRINVDIVKRSDHDRGFVVLPKRWIVERTLAWLNRCRRLAKDWEISTARRLPFCVSLPSA